MDHYAERRTGVQERSSGSPGRHRIFDAHVHIIDPRFRLVPNEGWLPEPFTVPDLRAAFADLPVDVVGGAVVSGSFQGVDQRYLVDALDRLGEGWVGVTQLPDDTGAAEIRRLHRRGVRGLRVDLRRSAPGRARQLKVLAPRVHQLVGWHTEVYVDGAELPDLERTLSRVPRLSIDHLGLPSSLDGPGFAALLRLVERGAWVKASGFGRQRVDVAQVLRSIVAVDPAALVFGTDMPSTRAPRPFAPSDIDLVVATVGQDVGARVLRDNGLDLYRAAR